MKKEVKETLLLVVLPLILTTICLTSIGSHSTNQMDIHLVTMKNNLENVNLCSYTNCIDDSIIDINHKRTGDSSWKIGN